MKIYVDFEMNEIHDNKGEVISIGAIKVVDRVITDEFHTLVCPVLTDFISPMITIMTGLKYEDLVNAPYFYTAFHSFMEWSCEAEVIYCWGSADVDSIYYSYSLNERFLKRKSEDKKNMNKIIKNKFLDLREYIEIYDYTLSRLSLVNLHQCMLNKKINMRNLHNPVYDSYLLFEIHTLFKDKLTKEKFHFQKEGSVLNAESM